MASSSMSFPVTVVEHPVGGRSPAEILDDEEYGSLAEYLAMNPLAGDVIPETGGVRKLRWRMAGRGKRGGLRIIYYYHDPSMPIFLLQAYQKGEKANLTSFEKKTMAAVVKGLVASHRTAAASRRKGSARR